MFRTEQYTVSTPMTANFEKVRQRERQREAVCLLVIKVVVESNCKHRKFSFHICFLDLGNTAPCLVKKVQVVTSIQQQMR